MTKRLLWIDWMKVLGMFCIVWGHFFSTGYQYLYVFNVPVFFLISGFLTKREDKNTFWHKILHNLFLPLVLISSINFLLHEGITCIKGGLSVSEILSFPFLLVGGSWRELGGMWFVYTLIILKILFQGIPSKKIYYALVFVVLTALLFYFHKIYSGILNIGLLKHPNAVLNICTGYPFFTLGYLLREKRAFFNTLNLSISYVIIGLLIAGGGVLLCGYYNAPVWMYMNGFGNNFLLFLIGGISGTVAIYIISKKLERFTFNGIKILSQGCIIILGFQMIFIKLILLVFPTRSLWDALWSIIVMSLFIPIILFIKRYIPCLLGNRSKSDILY